MVACVVVEYIVYEIYVYILNFVQHRVSVNT